MISKVLKPVVGLGVVLLGALPVVACTVADGDAESSVSDLSSTCGNGTRDEGEQCDDSNGGGLDGCSSSCQFEQMHRVNKLAIQFATSSFCSANALGRSVSSLAQGQIRDALTNAVNDGTISILLQFANLSDLTGQNAQGIELGSFIGKPAEGPGYDGSSDLDWVYAPDRDSLGPDGQPQAKMTASITNRAFSAGPGNVSFALALADSTAKVKLSNVKIRATVGNATTPNVSGGPTVGHGSSLQLDPTLKTFASTSGGELCGNISAESLANMKVPAALQQGGSAGCSENYNNNNSVLDVLVGGCRVFIQALSPTQPDQADPTTEPVGAGAPYKFQVGAGRKVTGCKDKSGATVDLGACLKNATFSSAFQFGTGRVVVR